MSRYILFLVLSCIAFTTLAAKIRIKSIQPATSTRTCDGSILIEATGEVGPFTVRLPELELIYSEVNGTVLVNNLCVGSYTVEVITTGRFQCSKILTAEISTGITSLVGGDKGENPSDLPGLDQTKATDSLTDFMLFPNPTDGQLNVRLQGFREAPIQLTFYAANGQQMYRFRAFQEHVHTIPVDLSGLPIGTYFAVLQDNQGKTYTKKLIIRP